MSNSAYRKFVNNKIKTTPVYQCPKCNGLKHQEINLNRVGRMLVCYGCGTVMTLSNLLKNGGNE